MKKFIIIALVIVLIISIGLVYLNQVILPQKIYVLIVNALQNYTGKKVALKSVEFNPFQGLVLHDLVISENEVVILSTRKASCGIFIWPILKKQIIIPNLNLEAPYIFVKRQKDGSFNLQDFFHPFTLDTAGTPVAKSAVENLKSPKSEFNVVLYKFNISSGQIAFQDDSLAQQFKKEIKNISLSVFFSLPESVKFNLQAEITQVLPVLITAQGEYKFSNQSWQGNIKVNNLSWQEFGAYYNNLGQDILGLADLQAQVNCQAKSLAVDLGVQTHNLTIIKDKLKIKLDLALQAKIKNDFATNKFSFAGFCDMQHGDILGIDFLGEIKELSGRAIFNERSLVAEKLKVQLLNLPFEIELGVKDFTTPVFNINTNFDLNDLPVIAKEKFNFALINSAQGKAFLTLKLHPDEQGNWSIRGRLDVPNANLKLTPNIPIENLAAVLEFSQQALSWSITHFGYLGKEYKSSGTMVNFAEPNLDWKLFSQDLSLIGNFDFLGKRIKVSQVKGKYFNSEFLLSGFIDNSQVNGPQLDLKGKINLKLEDLEQLLSKQYPVIKSFKPSGELDADFSLQGNGAQLKDCLIQATVSSSNLSLYGLTLQDFYAEYAQEKGSAKIPALRFIFYEGTFTLQGAMNLEAENPPYQIEFAATDINLAKLKDDTSAKAKNISGTLKISAKLDGFLNDLDKLKGAGNFAILQGRIWEFNLLEGLGKLLFTKDLGNVAVSQCSADFAIKDKFISTGNLSLKSEVANFSGPLKIGFDGSLDGALSVEILSQMVPLKASLKDVATGIMGQMGTLGVIKLSGSLVKPEHVFKPLTSNIVKGLTDIIFGNKH